MFFKSKISESNGYSVAEVSVALVIVAAIAVAGIKIVGEKYSRNKGASTKVVNTTIQYILRELRDNRACLKSFGGVKLVGRSSTFESIRTVNGVSQFRVGNKISNDFELSLIKVRYLDSVGKNKAFMLKLLFRSLRSSKYNYVHRHVIYGETDNNGKITNCMLGKTLTI